MTSMERETLNVLAENEGKLHYYLIAQELRISAHYADVICKSLKRNGYVDFDALEGICRLTEKGKDTIEKDRFFRLARRRESIQKKRQQNKKRIMENAETIHY